MRPELTSGGCGVMPTLLRRGCSGITKPSPESPDWGSMRLRMNDVILRLASRQRSPLGCGLPVLSDDLHHVRGIAHGHSKTRW